MVVRAVGADREDRIASAHQEHILTPNLDGQHPAIYEITQRDRAR
jgi:hypothetical protein